MRPITAATSDYERWIGKHLRLLPDDLALKHERMRADVFAFFRATFYRFAERWPDLPELDRAPQVLAVGDLHVENFGTWRDAEGRLAWGINDFDEACMAPYTLDLVRLATSTLLAIRGSDLALKPHAAVAAIAAGYRDATDGEAHPWVLEEGQDSLRALAYAEQRNPTRFWDKLDALPELSPKPPAAVVKILQQALPAGCEGVRFVHRASGLGSLGRERYAAIGRWHGARVAREAKALAPSAWHWARATRPLPASQSESCWKHAVRVPDPFLAVRDGWLVRRLAPYSSRIELSALGEKRDEELLLRTMGSETANVHRGSPSALAAIRDDLGRRPADWLPDAARTAVAAVIDDWEDWRRSG